MKLTSLFASAAGVSVAAALFAGAPRAQVPAVAATPPPTPPPIGTPASPQPNASLLPEPGITPSYGPVGAKPSTTPTPTPPPNARKGLEGVWELQIQHPNSTDYTHFALKQEGDALSGTYLDARGKKYPIAGSVDGQAVRLIVSMPNGTTLLLEGKLDGTTDMIGVLTMPDGQVPFTAAYRAKEKWIDNVNAAPGGMGGGMGGGQPGGGGYTPP